MTSEDVIQQVEKLMKEIESLYDEIHKLYSMVLVTSRSEVTVPKD